MPSLTAHGTIAYRLTEILLRLNAGQALEPQQLAEEFNVHERTIRRDLNERFAFIGLEKKDDCYTLARTRLGTFSLQGMAPRPSPLRRGANTPGGASTNATSAADKSKVTAGVLALLLGGIGVHKFYTGAWGWGIVYIVLCWTYVPALVALVEGIRYLTLAPTDFERKAAQMQGPFAWLW